jgi:hypothetical protein
MFYAIPYVVIFESKRYADEPDGAANNSANIVLNVTNILLHKNITK